MPSVVNSLFKDETTPCECDQDGAKTEKIIDCSLIKSTTFTILLIGFVLTSGVVAVITTSAVLTAIARYPPPPISFKDKVSGYKNAPIYVYPLKNDIDIKGLEIFISDFTNGTHGTVSQRDSSTLIYQSFVPTKAKDDVFQYTVSNRYSQSKNKVFVQLLNRPPHCPILHYNITTNGQFTFDLFEWEQNGTRIMDKDGDQLILTNVFNVGHGTVEWNDHSIIYKPKYKFKGNDYLSYNISDGMEFCVGRMNIQIFNRAPIAIQDHYTISKNQKRILNVTGNDLDYDGDDLEIVSLHFNSVGNAQISADKKQIIYYPMVTGPSFTILFSYTIRDDEYEANGQVQLDIQNYPPFINNKTFPISKNSDWNELILEFGDEDELETLDLFIAKEPTFGSYRLEKQWVKKEELFLEQDVIIRNVSIYRLFYKPLLYSSYTEIFSVGVIDSGNLTSIAHLTMQVGNLAPFAFNKTSSCPKRGQTKISIEDIVEDGDKDLLSLYSVFSQSGNVSILNSTHFVYTSPSHLLPLFDQVMFTITDQTAYASGWVRIYFTNDPPFVVDDFFIVPKGSTVRLDVLKNDLDSNRDILFIDKVYPSLQNAILQIVEGKWLEYTSFNTSYEDEFYYSIRDEENATSVNLGKVVIHAGNIPPFAINDQTETKWNRSVLINVLSNDYDLNVEDNAWLSISSYTQPIYGNVQVVQNQFYYTPNLGFVGNDSFSYRCMDLYNQSNWANVSIQVKNQQPLAACLEYSIHWRIPFFIFDVLQNASDPDSDKLYLWNATAIYGKMAISPWGSEKWVYYPPSIPFSELKDQINYTITDWNLKTSNKIQIYFTNSAPVAVADSYSFHWNRTLKKLNLLDNDYDPNHDPIWLVSFQWMNSKPCGKLYTLDNESVWFESFGNFTGIQWFQYTITDGVSFSTSNVSISLTNEHLPYQNGFNVSKHWKDWSQGVFIPILPWNVDLDGDVLHFQISGHSGWIQKFDTFVIYQKSNWKGTECWSVIVSDGMANVSFPVCVSSWNQIPIVPSLILSDYCGPEIQQGKNTSILWQIYDLDAVDSVQFVNHSNPKNGTMYWTGSNLFYLPNAGYWGTENVTYCVSDGMDIVCSLFSIRICFVDFSNLWKFYSLPWRMALSGWNQTVKWNESQIQIISILSLPQYGNVALLNSTTFFYQSFIPLVATDSFTLQVNHSLGILVSMTIWIRMENQLPNVKPVFYSKHWRNWYQSIQLLNVLVNSTDADGDSLNLISVSTSSYSTPFVFNGTQIGYLSSAPFTGFDSFLFHVSDGMQSISQIATIQSTNLNKPNLPSQIFSSHWRNLTQYGFNYSFAPLDLDGDTQKVELIIPTIGKTIVGSSFVYYNRSKWVGQESISLSISDGIDTHFFLLTIQSTNTPPFCKDDIYTFARNQSRNGVIICPLWNDTDSNFDPIQLVLWSGSLLSNQISFWNGSCLYYQGSNVGMDTISYTISDQVSTASCQMNIRILNNPPTCTSSSYSTLWRNNVLIRLNGTDADGDAVSYSIASTPTLGTLISNTSSLFQFQPVVWMYQNKNSVPFTSIESISYSCFDGVDTTYATIWITIFNHPPVAIPDGFTFLRNRTHNPQRLLFVLSNDYDKDNDDLTIASLSFSSSSSISISSDKKSILYQPLVSFLGTETIFYTVSDGNVQNNSGAVSISIINVPPVCPFSIVKSNLIKNVVYKWYLLNEAGCYDLNGDSLVLQNASPIKSTTSIGQDANGYFVLFQSLTHRSGSENLIFNVFDGQVSISLTVQVSVNNRAPLVSSANVSIPSKAYACPSPSVLILNDAVKEFNLEPYDDVFAGFYFYPNIGSSNSYWVSIEKILVTFLVNCGSKNGPLHNFTVSIPNQQYLVPSGSTSAIPSNDKNNDDTFQSGSIIIPNICNGNRLYFVRGSILSAYFFSNDLTKTFYFKYHFGKKTDSPWSKLFTIQPNCKLESGYSQVQLFSPYLIDPDGDSVVLHSIVDLDNCLNNPSVGGTLTLQNSTTIRYTARNGFASTCRYQYVYKDLDIDQQMFRTSAISTIQVYYLPPMTKPTLFTTTQKTKSFAVSINQILNNDYDPNGQMFTLDRILCNQTKTCKLDYTWSTSSNDLIFDNSDEKACGDYLYEYIIKSPFTQLSTIGQFTVRYTDCTCKSVNDIIYLVDGTSTISSSQWSNIKSFLSKLVDDFDIGWSKIRVANVQYSYMATYSNVKYGFNFEGKDRATVKSKINSLEQLVSPTRQTIQGIDVAQQLGNTWGRNGVQKTIVLLTVGAPNSPCSCQSCFDYYGPIWSYPRTCNSTVETCNSCEWNPNQSKYCMPCADFSKMAIQIQSNPDWKMITIGIGSSIPSITQSLLQQSAFDVSASFFPSWSQISDPNFIQLVLDKIC